MDRLFFFSIVGFCGLSGAVVSLACQGEDIAPTCSVADEQGRCLQPSPGLVLSLDCSKLPRAVQSANYEFVIQHPGLPPGHKSQWEATGLPPGLVMEQGGILRGRPEKVGIYSDIVVTMRDITSAQSKSVTCGALQVFDALSLDLSSTKHGCVSHGDRIEELLRGGTEEALFCEVPKLEQGGDGCAHGLGNGRMPPGVSVQKDCTLTGEVDPLVREDGTFVWIVELRQSGAQLFVPFCATAVRSNQHVVELFHGGSALDRYSPLQVSFDPDQPLQAGTKDDPRIYVTAACNDRSCATRGISVRGTCSPFDQSVNNLLDRSAEPEIRNGRTIGLKHGFDLHTSGQTPTSLGLGERPWVMSLNSKYCTSGPDQPDPCMAPTTLTSQTTWSVIAWPTARTPKLPNAR